MERKEKERKDAMPLEISNKVAFTSRVICSAKNKKIRTLKRMKENERARE